jgi:hypothetical protein
VVFFAGFFIDLSPSRRISRGSFDSIKPGMAVANVENVVGPPGVYFTRKPSTREYRFSSDPQGWKEPDGWQGPVFVALAPRSTAMGTGIDQVFGNDGSVERKEWSGDRGGIVVSFDRNGRAVGKAFYAARMKLKWWYWTVLDLGIYDWQHFVLDQPQDSLQLVDW